MSENVTITDLTKIKPQTRLFIERGNDLFITALFREYDTTDDTLYLDSKDLGANMWLHNTSQYSFKVSVEVGQEEPLK